jgi:hypothetical protein
MTENPLSPCFDNRRAKTQPFEVREYTGWKCRSSQNDGRRESIEPQLPDYCLQDVIPRDD